MKTYCSVCFYPDPEPLCPHCGANTQHIARVQMLEQRAEERNTESSLREISLLYQQMGRAAAVGRILGRLVRYSLRLGHWPEALDYLHQLLSLGEAAGTASFRNEAKRQLAAILGRVGELPLATHLLTELENGGYSEATLERLRLELENEEQPEALATLDKLMAEQPNSLRVKAWRLETLARFQKLRDPEEAERLISAAQEAQDPYSAALAVRALGVYRQQNEDYAAAAEHLGAAVRGFMQQGAPYEAARSQIDLARALMNLNPTDDHPTHPKPEMEAARWLNGAMLTLRRMGATQADEQATALARMLASGQRQNANLTSHTSSSVALIWVALDGKWASISRAQLMALAAGQGALVESWPQGVILLFGQAQHQGDMRLIVETMLAVHLLLSHHTRHINGSKGGIFRVAAGMGMLPQDHSDLIGTLNGLPKTRLYKELHERAQYIPPGVMIVNDLLHMSTSERFRYVEQLEKPIKPATPDETTPSPLFKVRWWRLASDQYSALETPAALMPASRADLPQHSGGFSTIDPLLSLFKERKLGGLIAITGMAGSGKSRLIDVLRAELPNGSNSWLIHLRGRNAPRHQPFGAMRHWLEAEIQQPASTPSERYTSQLATFRRSILGLLNSKPLILIVDDVPLLDSGSLAALRAVLPLIATHPLLIILAGRGAQDESSAGWRELVEIARRALPDRAAHIHLRPTEDDPTLYYQRLDDLNRRHVLACAAVLGDSFPTLVLNRVCGLRDLSLHLQALHADGILTPFSKAESWQFNSSAQRDAILELLPPDYRAILHWYTRQTLKILSLPSDAHVAAAGLSEPSLAVSLRHAQEALDMDCPQEALIHFDRAISLYEGSSPAADLLLSRVGALLQLERWEEAENAMHIISQYPELEIEDKASLLIYQGELHYRVGEVASLFRYYEQAAALLRELPQNDPSGSISMTYALALARFKRGEIEMARSLVGHALMMAERAKLEIQAPHLWELMAEIHQRRGELEQATRAISEAIKLYSAGGQNWSLRQPLEKAGLILLESGQLESAQKHLSEALALAEAIGEADSIMRLRRALSRVAFYTGHFGQMTEHLSAALDAALFTLDQGAIVRARTDLAEGLAWEGRAIKALNETTLALRIARLYGDTQAQIVCQLTLGRVSLALNCPEDAEQALDKAAALLTSDSDPDLRFKLGLALMEMGLSEGGDLKHYAEGLARIQALPHILRTDVFLEARLNLLIGQHYAQVKHWNLAALEFERASKAFGNLGASYWQRQARSRLKEIAPHAPGYRTMPQYTRLRSG